MYTAHTSCLIKKVPVYIWAEPVTSEIIFVEWWWHTLIKIKEHFIYFQTLTLEVRWYLDKSRLCLNHIIWIILCMRPANERRRYNVTSSLIGWAHTQNDPWYHMFIEMYWNSSNALDIVGNNVPAYGLGPAYVTASVWKMMIKFECTCDA